MNKNSPMKHIPQRINLRGTPGSQPPYPALEHWLSFAGCSSFAAEAAVFGDTVADIKAAILGQLRHQQRRRSRSRQLEHQRTRRGK